MDVLIDEGMDKHALPEQREQAAQWRQIGLGFFGLADALIAMGLRYGSYEAVHITEKITATMFGGAFDASRELGKELGVYPKCDPDVIVKSALYQSILASSSSVGKGMRNATLLAIAPTGSIATMLGVSTGIEPLFATEYTRTTKTLHGAEYTYTVRPDVVERAIAQNNGEVPDYVVTAHDIPWRERLEMQAAVQKYVDSSISSTVNLPHDTSVQEVSNLFIAAWEKGLKGVCVFRDGCERAAILNAGSTDTTDAPPSEPEPEVIAPPTDSQSQDAELKRGDIVCIDDGVVGLKRKLTTGCGTLHCSAFFDPVSGDLTETYLSKGSLGGCNNWQTAASRLISLAVRGGIDVTEVIDQLLSSGACPSYASARAKGLQVSPGACCAGAVATALRSMCIEMNENLRGDEPEPHSSPEMHRIARAMREEATANMERLKAEEARIRLYAAKEQASYARALREAAIVNTDRLNAEEEGARQRASRAGGCPECGGELSFEGGCNICRSCGYSKCS
jgi:ribonucleoside-diphosphate reductase alpha chain